MAALPKSITPNEITILFTDFNSFICATHFYTYLCKFIYKIIFTDLEFSSFARKTERGVVVIVNELNNFNLWIIKENFSYHPHKLLSSLITLIFR